MARVLFIHPNFPAQFKHLSKNLSDNGFEVRFLCQTYNSKEINGVKRIVIKSKEKKESGKFVKRYLESKSQRENSEIYRQIFEKFKVDGWMPDYVISHSGWGCGTYVKACWPKTTLISYLEWWFNPASEFYSYDENNLELKINQRTSLIHWKKNNFLALELASADKIIAPTKWQRNQLPTIFKVNTSVVFDGINIQKFNTQPKSRSINPLVTYGTRGMEPVRAFKQFICEIPNILRIDKNITIEISGYDEIFYGGLAPEGNASWGSWAKKYLKDKGIDERVRWLGYLSEEEYICWLKRSWCHVYLTHPFVLSWSFLEAYASGCPLVCSNVAPVQEFADQSCIKVDHRLGGGICQGVKTLLSDDMRWKRSQQRSLEHLSHTHTYERFVRVTGVEVATSA